jgi:hypothetical protein
METKTEVRGVSRRTVARGAAWAAPVALIAVGAPAYAATSGSCTDFGTAPLTQSVGTKVGLLVFPPSTNQAVVSIAATDASGKTIAQDRLTGTLQHTDYSPGWNYIDLHQAAGMHEGDRLTMTLTFSRPVENLTLTITDIDKIKGEWIDQVFVAPPGFSAVPGPNVSGSGLAGDPFTANVDAEIHTAAGDLTLTWAGPLTTAQISYRAGDAANTSTNGQHIGVGKIGFSNCA